MPAQPLDNVCRYNDAIDCDAKECYHCGWDPKVANERRKAFMKEMNEQTLYKVPFTGYCEVWAKSPEEAAEKAENIDQQFFAHYDYGEPVCSEEKGT